MDETERLVELIPRLRRYARALVGDRASADDLVQDTLERAWAKLHLYRQGTDLRAWLFTVMHNVHVNRVRATRISDPLGDEMPELAQRGTQADALLVRHLDRAIARLPADQRAVLLLAPHRRGPRVARARHRAGCARRLVCASRAQPDAERAGRRRARAARRRGPCGVFARSAPPGGGRCGRRAAPRRLAFKTPRCKGA